MTPRQIRDLGALLLILGGVAGLIVCAFLFSSLLGAAAVFAVLLVAGLLLGYSRDVADVVDY